MSFERAARKTRSSGSWWIWRRIVEKRDKANVLTAGAFLVRRWGRATRTAFLNIVYKEWRRRIQEQGKFRSKAVLHGDCRIPPILGSPLLGYATHCPSCAWITSTRHLPHANTISLFYHQLHIASDTHIHSHDNKIISYSFTSQQRLPWYTHPIYASHGNAHVATGFK